VSYLPSGGFPWYLNGTIAEMERQKAESENFEPIHNHSAKH